MFLDFYELKEQPFGVTPDPRYLYLSASHREALASLFYGVKTGRGLLALIAPPGMGKTTLLFRFLEHLKRSARTAFLFQTQCDSYGLLRYLLADLQIDARGQDFFAMHEKLNELLLREASSGRRFVLVIDEAQNLDDSVLETARLLSDFETPREKLLQIVFAGQSQLAEKLERPELAQLRQRIAVLCRLEPLGAAEVSRYIEHRLRVAGYKGGPLFTSTATDRIAECSQGIPRNINNLCFSALSLGCALRRKLIDADLIAEAAADLDVSSVADQRRRERPPVVLPVSAGPAAPASKPEHIVSREVIQVVIYEDQNKEAEFEQAKSEPLDDLLEPPNDLLRTLVPFAGVGPGDVEIELIALELGEEVDGASEVPEVSSEAAFQQPVLAPDAFERALADGQMELANEATSTEFREGIARSSEAPAHGRYGGGEKPRSGFDAGLARSFHHAQTVVSGASDFTRQTKVVGRGDHGAGNLVAGRPTPYVASHSCTSNLPGEFNVTKLFRPTAPARVSTECLPILLTAERNWLARVAVAASVFVLALVTAISYRQDIKIAAAQTRETVVIAAASFSAHFSAVKTGPVATFADPEQMVPVKTPGLTNRDVTNATAVLARPTPTIETQAGASASRARARQAWVPIRSRIERAESPEVESTGGIVIVVQPRDGLRQICLRHFGSYNERLVKEISKLNPELTDPDRIDIGQRIVLPQFGGDRLHVPRSSVITKP